MRVILTVFAVFIALANTQGLDEELEAELKCLQNPVTDQCDLQVTYPVPVGVLACEEQVPTNRISSLQSAPTLHLPTGVSTPHLLVYMFDPDAPAGNTPAIGFVHWIALATIGEDSKVSIRETLLGYVKPTPPAQDGPHRYQIFIFSYEGAAQDVAGGSSRIGELCSFMGNNTLGQPLASFQFHYQS